MQKCPRQSIYTHGGLATTSLPPEDFETCWAYLLYHSSSRQVPYHTADCTILYVVACVVDRLLLRGGIGDGGLRNDHDETLASSTRSMRYRKQYSNGFSVQSTEMESIANHEVIMLEVGSFNVRRARCDIPASSRIDRRHRGSCKRDSKHFFSLRFPSQCIGCRSLLAPPKASREYSRRSRCDRVDLDPEKRIGC